MTSISPTFNEPELPSCKPIAISLADGNLNPKSVGWSRQPVQVDNLRGYWPRKKRWNYWCAISPECLFSVTMSNIDYMGLAFAYFLDFETLKFTEQTVMMPFGKDCILPPTVAGQIDFKHPQMTLSMDDRVNTVDLLTESPNFQGQSLRAELHISRPAELESLNVMIPWSQRRYHFTSKQACLPAGGSVQVGDRAYNFDAQRDFACLDYGRGIWKYRSFWNWSCFSCRVGTDVIGVNLGGGWTDGSGATENSLLFNGRLEKLSETVAFEYDPQNFMKPWHLKTLSSNQVDLTFTPFYERVAKTDVILVRSEVHQMIGRFTGTVRSADGRAFDISSAIGWAEEHNACW